MAVALGLLLLSTRAKASQLHGVECLSYVHQGLVLDRPIDDTLMRDKLICLRARPSSRSRRGSY